MATLSLQIWLQLALLLLLASTNTAWAFTTPRAFLTRSSSTNTALFGISEWRSSTINKNRTILLLPFALEAGTGIPLLPGQSTLLEFRHDQHLAVLEEALESCSGVIGAILVQEGDDEEDEVLTVFPLCEIQNYCALEATVTLKCMGRAHLTEEPTQQLSSSGQKIQGHCFEVKDGSLWERQLSCDELVQDIEQMVESQPDLSSKYQQGFWASLTSLGYSPTNLLTRDPASSNSQKEIEAASWAGMACLDMDDDLDRYYDAFASTSTLERLQWIRRGLLAQNIERAEEASAFGSMLSGMDEDVKALGVFQ